PRVPALPPAPPPRRRGPRRPPSPLSTPFPRPYPPPLSHLRGYLLRSYHTPAARAHRQAAIWQRIALPQLRWGTSTAAIILLLIRHGLDPRELPPERGDCGSRGARVRSLTPAANARGVPR